MNDFLCILGGITLVLVGVVLLLITTTFLENPKVTLVNKIQVMLSGLCALCAIVVIVLILELPGKFPHQSDAGLCYEGTRIPVNGVVFD